jgi:hypothetical protein
MKLFFSVFLLLLSLNAYANITVSSLSSGGVGSESDPLSLHKDGSVPLTSNWNIGGFKITNLTDPTNDQDAATKAYCDNIVEFHVYVDKMNDLLDSLDNDVGVSDTDYYTLEVTQVNLWKTNFNSLLTKLDNDTGVGYTNYSSTYAITDPSDLKTNYNGLLSKLDTDTGVAKSTHVSEFSI